nr:YitT family protein [uncultured Dysosmobacter sp.]
MKRFLKSYSIITLGSLVFALAFDWFYAPNQVAMGGVTGIAQVINALVPQLSVGLLTIVINIPLFFAGWRLIGAHLLLSSLFSMAVSSLAIDLIAAFWAFAPMDPMLACLCGSAMMGAGFGLVFSQGATTGGTDIVARLLKLKLPWLPMGKLLLVPDGVVLALAALTFGRIDAALYGAVGLFVSTRVMDAVLYGPNTAKVAYIISDSWEEISAALLGQDRGVTILQGQGAYTHHEKQVLLIAFRQKEIVQIKRIVHEADPRAFFIVCNAHEVLGEGFVEYQKEEI